MEAVPKLPMIYFELKISPVCPDFAMPFKNFISKHYSEDGNSYEREINELEALRNKASRVPRDFTGCSLLKRYYSQIYSLLNRFSAFESNVGVECVWADIYSGQTMIGDLDFELSCILYNVGALHAELGALDMRTSADNMKVSCTHFQCAAWAFQHLRDDSRLYKSKDMLHELLSFFVQVMLSQAQECILEKSMLDNRKSSIVAKVAAQVVEYYSSALLILLQSAVNTTASHTIVDIVGSKIYKEWKKFIEFKVSYYNSICALFMGNLAEEQQKMGERVAWFQSAEIKLNEAIKQCKQMDRPELNEALNFVSDVINVKLGNAIKENDFVYHEKVPTSDKLTEVKGVSLVKGIPFSVCDPEICGNDIFGRLVPIEAHETNSIYSAKKDEIMRCIGIKIDDKNDELAAYMSSLQLDKDTVRVREEHIPDQLIEVCAQMSVDPNAVSEVTDVLNELEEISDEVDRAINETKTLLEDEDSKEKEHQSLYGKRPTSMIVVELNKELAKHDEIHKKALLSNSSLRDNLERHCDDIKLLISSSAQTVSSLLPSSESNVPFDESNLAEMEKLLDKVNEMKNQRSLLENQLRDTMASDDLMKQVLTHNKQQIEEVFNNEIKKYDKTKGLIEQNLSAQENILRALTKANAKYTETRRALLDNERNRSTRIASLIHTFDIFKELQTNSKKGLEFYQKFQNIVDRLHARTRGVCRVQDEERTQISSSHRKPNFNNNFNDQNLNNNYMATNGDNSNTPKLKDYLKNFNSIKPIPASNMTPNNYYPIVPPAQNYPPTSLSQNLPQNVSQNLSQTVPQNLPQHLPNNTIQTLSQNLPQNIPQSIPQNFNQKLSQNIAQNLPQNMSQNIPQSLPQTFHQNMPQNIPQNIPQSNQQHTPQNIQQHLPQNIPQHIAQNIPQSLPQNMLQNIPQNTAQNISQSLPQNLPQSYTQNVSPNLSLNYSQNTSQNFTPNLSQSLSYSTPQTVQQSLPYSMPYNVPQSLPQYTAPNMTYNVPQSYSQTAQNLAYSVPQSMPQNTLQNMTYSTPQSLQSNVSYSVPQNSLQNATYSLPQSLQSNMSYSVPQNLPQSTVQPYQHSVAQPNPLPNNQNYVYNNCTPNQSLLFDPINDTASPVLPPPLQPQVMSSPPIAGQVNGQSVSNHCNVTSLLD